MAAKRLPWCTLVLTRATAAASPIVARMTPEDQRVKPAKPVPPASRNRNQPPPRRELESVKPTNRFRVLYIVISGLVICSFIAVALTTIDFGSLFGDDQIDDTLNPNADLIADQQTVVANNPEDVDAIVLLANLLGNTGQIAEAIPWYERALELAPEDHGIRLDFARSLGSAGYTADAESQFLRVLDAEPDNQTAHYYLAELYLTSEPVRREEAREHYQRAAEIDAESFLGERARNELVALEGAGPTGSPASTPASPGS